LKPRQLALLLASIGLAAVLAYVLRGVIQAYVILPAARLFWRLRVDYLSIPQIVFWVLLVVALIVVTVDSFRLRESREQRSRRLRPTRPGELQQLVFWLQRSQRGVYSQWYLANTLANLALDILQQRSGEMKRGQRLEGPGWAPPENVQKYLETALRTTYADYPRRSLFAPRRSTPLDGDLDAVVAYLESLLEEKHAPRNS